MQREEFDFYFIVFSSSFLRLILLSVLWLEKIAPQQKVRIMDQEEKSKKVRRNKIFYLIRN
jgi:hypothetical protein